MKLTRAQLRYLIIRETTAPDSSDIAAHAQQAITDIGRGAQESASWVSDKARGLANPFPSTEEGWQAKGSAKLAKISSAALGVFGPNKVYRALANLGKADSWQSWIESELTTGPAKRYLKKKFIERAAWRGLGALDFGLIGLAIGIPALGVWVFSNADDPENFVNLAYNLRSRESAPGPLRYNTDFDARDVAMLNSVIEGTGILSRRQVDPEDWHGLVSQKMADGRSPLLIWVQKQLMEGQPGNLIEYIREGKVEPEVNKKVQAAVAAIKDKARAVRELKLLVQQEGMPMSSRPAERGMSG